MSYAPALGAAVLCSSLAVPVVNAEDAPVPEMRTVLCAAASMWRNEARVKQVFGEQNVTTGAVEGWDGVLATIIYANDPRQKLALLWEDEARRAKLKAAIVMADPSARWTTPVMWQSEGLVDGVKVGDTIAQLETLNAKPFLINGLGAEGGWSLSWNGGNLGNGCKLSVLLLPEDPNAVFPTGSELSSNSPEVIAVQPRVAQFTVRF